MKIQTHTHTHSHTHTHIHTHTHHTPQILIQTQSSICAQHTCGERGAGRRALADVEARRVVQEGGRVVVDVGHAHRQRQRPRQRGGAAVTRLHVQRVAG